MAFTYSFCLLQVQQAIYKNLSGRTVVIIAHRLSTVEKADRIIVIDKGQVIEQGKHSQLLAQNGLYARLVQRQLLGFDEASVMRNSSNDDDASCKRRHSASVSSGEHVNTNTSSQAVTRKHSFSGSPIKYFRRKSSSPKQEFYSPPSRGSPTFYDLTDKWLIFLYFDHIFRAFIDIVSFRLLLSFVIPFKRCWKVVHVTNKL